MGGSPAESFLRGEDARRIRALSHQKCGTSVGAFHGRFRRTACWFDHACRGCSLGADQVGHLAHLNARDTTLAYASRAPQKDIERLKARMGWKMPWYTITDGFDKDFGVDEWHGHNAFIRDGDKVFRTYFINSRGDEAMGNTWSYLDMTALGRQETWEDSPEGYPQTKPYKWWNWHDNYDAEASPDPKWADIITDPQGAALRRRDAEAKA